MDDVELAEVVERGLHVGLPGLVGDEDEPGVVADALLLERADRHAVALERLGHRPQHAGPVDHVEVDVVARLQLVDGPDGPAGEREQVGVGALAEVDRGVDEVAEHGRAGGVAAGAPAVEHEVADGGALDEHGVERVAHAGQRVGQRDHGRVDADGHLVGPVAHRDQLGHGQELDDVAQPAGELDVGGGDVGDALVVHVAGHHLGAEGERGEDGRLGPGVVALDVGGGVPLGVAQLLAWFGRLDAVVWVALAGILGAAWLSPRGDFAMQFVLVPLIAAALFAAARYPLRWSSMAVLCVGAFIVVALHQGHQPFGALAPRLAVLRAQEFLFLTTLLALGFGAMLRQLRAQQAELERRVAERTAELEEANARLLTLAAVDPLSGVANRRSFSTRSLGAESARSVDRYGGRSR